MTRLPRLLDSAMKERCRLRPERVRLVLNLMPLSAAMLVLPPGEEKIVPGDFMELYEP